MEGTSYRRPRCACFSSSRLPFVVLRSFSISPNIDSLNQKCSFFLQSQSESDQIRGGTSRYCNNFSHFDHIFDPPGFSESYLRFTCCHRDMIFPSFTSLERRLEICRTMLVSCHEKILTVFSSATEIQKLLHGSETIQYREEYSRQYRAKQSTRTRQNRRQYMTSSRASE